MFVACGIWCIYIITDRHLCLTETFTCFNCFSKCSGCVSGIIDGHWGRWMAYSTCTATCGQGTRTRTRLCDDPTPQRGGNKCAGSGVERVPCTLKPCEVKPVNPVNPVRPGGKVLGKLKVLKTKTTRGHINGFTRAS